MTAWIIEDHGAQGLAPLCDLRATFEQRTGGLTTLERLTKQMGCSPSGFICENETRAAMISSRTGLACVSDVDATDVDHPQIETPWSVLDNLPSLLIHDLENADSLGCTCEVATYGDHRIDIHPSASLLPDVVLDASRGAIRIEDGSVVHPNAVLVGPCWIGSGSIVHAQALVKSNTAIGPHCKIGGEIGGTIFQAYSNKCHSGHLGDSVIGEWVNFGAGTTNSNLLNTYGDVAVTDLDGSHHRTGRQFVGCFVGDHVKFAIETRIMTGTFVGTGAMIATTQPVPSPTPRLAWLTDNGTRTYRIEKFMDVARVVMARRDIELDAATEAVLRQLAG